VVGLRHVGGTLDSFQGAFRYLLAVHHVPEAGQRMNPDVDVFVLHGPHGELQRRDQVTAAGCQLSGPPFSRYINIIIIIIIIILLLLLLLCTLTFL